MRLADIVNGPWAITLPMYREVQAIYATHMRGEKIDVAKVEAAIGRPLNNVRRDYEVIDGVAVIPMVGVMAKRMNLFMEISGGVSMQIAASQVRQAVADPQVRQIVLQIDSPGGTVDGTQELANTIRAAREQKPVIALADGLMASAAYWAGSAAAQVFISADTVEVGSIGVVATHVDQSKRLEDAGVKVTEITAGKYKRIAGQYAPLTQEGRDYIQAQVDHLYTIFVDAVAENRGVTAEAVLERMADGRLFIGKQAIDAGLVDGVSTLDELIARAAAGEFDFPADNETAASGAGVAPAAASTNEETTMDMQKLKAEHGDLYEAVLEEGRKEGRTQGAEQERQRIKDVEASGLPGHEKLIQELKFDGKTTGEQAAVAVLNAERGKRGAHLQGMRDDAAAAGTVPAGADAPAANPAAANDANLSDEQKRKAAWDKDPELRAEFAGDFSRYEAYEKANANGQVRVMRRA